MAIQVCPTCSTQFIDGIHYWSGTGKQGNPKDLAGLVCNNLCGDRPCINPLKGTEGGMTWEKRLKNLTALEKEHEFDRVQDC
jgi:hypothetical protein